MKSLSKLSSMDYNILEARIEFYKGTLTRVTVLVEMSKGDVRAIFATAKPQPGYMHLSHSVVSDALLQEVAGYGLETVDRNEVFPGWALRYAKLENVNHR